MLHLIGFLKGTSNRSLKFYSNLKDSPTYMILLKNNITINEDTITISSDSSWNDCVDTGRSTGVNETTIQGGSVDSSSHLPTPVAMSSGEAEYISATATCMRASHLHIFTYDIKYLGTPKYDGDNLDYEPTKIIIDNNEAVAVW